MSPGTLFYETTMREVESWDVPAAVAASRDVVDRYGARPFGLVFTTMLTADPVPDGEGGSLHVVPREVARSGVYYINGRVRTPGIDITARGTDYA